MPIADETLLAEIARGSRPAFAEFYDRHSPRAFGLLLKMLRDRAVAEDVLQDVFWQVWQQAERFDASRGAPSLWVMLLTRSRAHDQLRKRRLTSADAALDRAVQQDPSEPIADAESTEQARAALTILPPEQRQLIDLSFYQGLTHQEIADATKLPLGTVKTRIRAALQRLREKLGAPSEASLA